MLRPIGFDELADVLERLHHGDEFLVHYTIPLGPRPHQVTPEQREESPPDDRLERPVHLGITVDCRADGLSQRLKQGYDLTPVERISRVVRPVAEHATGGGPDLGTRN